MLVCAYFGDVCYIPSNNRYLLGRCYSARSFGNRAVVSHDDGTQKTFFSLSARSRRIRESGSSPRFFSAREGYDCLCHHAFLSCFCLTRLFSGPIALFSTLQQRFVFSCVPCSQSLVRSTT